MTGKDLLEGKKILIVDDEPDVLDTLEELLSMCEVEKASSFEEAKRLLDTEHFDMAVLDIMGVDGYQLLAICNQKNLPAVMLTSHALSPENLVKSFKLGAASFVPKDRIADIAGFLSDVLQAKEKGEHVWLSWAAKLGEAYWGKKFGPNWRDQDKKFWKEFRYP